MTMDIEGVFQSLNEYLTGGQTAIGATADLAEPAVEEVHEPQAELFGPEDDVGEIAYQHARNLMVLKLTVQNEKVRLMKRDGETLYYTCSLHHEKENPPSCHEDIVDRHHESTHSKIQNCPQDHLNIVGTIVD